MVMKEFKNLKELEKSFKTNKDCLLYYESIRWKDNNRYCPHCNGHKYYVMTKAFQYKCANKACLKQFNVLTKTVFENTKKPLPVWFTAIYLVTSHKKGISSVQLSKDIGVTLHTAWFMLQRIRDMLKDKETRLLGGEVEIDETYIGGQEKYKKAKRELENDKKKATGYAGKTTVVGMREKGGKVITQVYLTDKVDGEILKPLIRERVNKKAIIVTDGFGGYFGLGKEYKKHEIVNHSKKEYVNKNGYTTNRIENFWSVLKRGLYGIYHRVSPHHLHRYCSEFAFRYNKRGMTESERFQAALFQGEGRLKYSEFRRKAVEN